MSLIPLLRQLKLFVYLRYMLYLAQFSSGGTHLLFWGIFSESLAHPENDFLEQKNAHGVFSALKTKKTPPPLGVLGGGGRAFFRKTPVRGNFQMGSMYETF